jgi:hypothetical protein
MKKIVCCLLFLLLVNLMGCGHIQTVKIGLLSIGDLEGKVIPGNPNGSVSVEGTTCGHNQYLSDAVREALKDKDIDTIVDADVTSTTGLLVWSNCLSVKGTAFDSKTLTKGGNQ